MTPDESPTTAREWLGVVGTILVVVGLCYGALWILNHWTGNEPQALEPDRAAGCEELQALAAQCEEHQ